MAIHQTQQKSIVQHTIYVIELDHNWRTLYAVYCRVVYRNSNTRKFSVDATWRNNENRVMNTFGITGVTEEGAPVSSIYYQGRIGKGGGWTIAVSVTMLNFTRDSVRFAIFSILVHPSKILYPFPTLFILCLVPLSRADQ